MDKKKTNTTKSNKKIVASKKDNTKWYIIVTAIACVALSIIISNKNNVDYEFTNIKTAEFKTLYASKDRHIVYIGRPTCSYCVKYAPVLKKVAYNNDLEVNYLDLDTLTADEQNEFLAVDKYLKDGQWGTPLVVIVGNNKIEEAKINGAQDEAATIEFFKTNKLIQ